MVFAKLTVVLILILICGSHLAWCQDYNNNPKISFINYNVPKSPESASFEKYGKIPIGEYTGTASINVPLYELKGKDVNIPIGLSYHASGIKVNQEATWVGLGWDLVPGGRILLEIKGGYDKYTDQYLNNDISKNIIKYLFEIGNFNPYEKNSFKAYSEEFAIYQGIPDLGGVQYGANLPTDKGFDRLRDFYPFINNMVNFGIGEPDIYHVSFLGKSFDFYLDLFTKKVVVKGEGNLFNVEENSTVTGKEWIITDDNGVKYFFSQEEITHHMTPVSSYYQDITTSWLLSKVVETNGDTTVFTYNNFGAEVAAPTISESESYKTGDPYTSQSNKDDINQLTLINPQYLVNIETKDTKIDFVLNTRNDLGGMGARRLEKIVISDKDKNKPIKHVDFNYDYFTSSDNSDYFNINLLDYQSATNTSVQDRMKLRLRLNSVNIGGANVDNSPQTYTFKYNSISLPNKLSLSQDHWGYFNGASNGPTGTVAFTPSVQGLVQEGIMTSFIIGPIHIGTTLNNINVLNLLQGHANRRANNDYAQAGILNSIIYPTGGWSSFEFELHKSSYEGREIIGGGLRIKRVTNFTALNKVANVTTYDYSNLVNKSSGLYLGTLEYLKIRSITDEVGPANPPSYNYGASITLMSNGNLTNGGPLIGYERVKSTQVDYLTNSNSGSIVKEFRVGIPFRTAFIIQNYNMNYTKHSLYESMQQLTPIPRWDIDGQLIKEIYYDRSNNLVKSVQNFYTQHLTLDTIYSLKVEDQKSLPPLNDFYIPAYFFEPTKTFFTTLDSTVTSFYDHGTAINNSISYVYNKYFQLEKSSFKSSNGNSLINITKTPLSFTNMPDVPGTSELSGDALAVQTLKMLRMYNKPIESISIVKKASQDSMVTRAMYQSYDLNGNAINNHQLENTAPIPLSLFQKAYYTGGSNGQILFDNKYQLKQTMDYYPDDFSLKQLTENGKTTSFIWDTKYRNLLAIGKNAIHKNIAFTSFEDNNSGNWTFNGGAINNTTAHSGERSFNLYSGATITNNLLSPGRYIVSYWSKSGSMIVNGSTSTVLKNANGWAFYEHYLNIATGNTVNLTGNGYIDDLRMYPDQSQLLTYTYKPLVGISSITDEKSKTTYFDFDEFSRLSFVKDFSQHIKKSYQYNFTKSLPTTNPTQLFFNKEKTALFSKNDCPAGQLSNSLSYSVTEGIFTSFITQEDADQQANVYLATAGQNYANLNCSCTTPLMATLNYQTPTALTFSIDLQGANQSYYYSISGSGSLTIPQGIYFVRINEINYSGTYNYNLNGLVQSGVMMSIFENVSLTGTADLSINSNQ